MARPRLPRSRPRSEGRRRARRKRLARSPRARFGAVAGVCAIAALGVVTAFGPVALGASAAGADGVRSAPPAATLQAPLEPFLAARLFDRPDAPWAAGHRGIDALATEGDEVLSPGDGVIAFAGLVVDRGVVTVDHGDGLVSSVEPITPTVAVGDHVRAGEGLGVVSGEPGHCAPRTCVHWGVRFRGEYVNPLDVLAGYGRIVLLP